MKYPTFWYMNSGVGVSEYHLNALDRALMEAGIGNYNNIKVTSIIPKNTVRVERLDVAEGSFLRAAIAEISSSTPGDQIASCIGAAVPDNKDCVGVIMEYHCHGSAKDAEDTCRAMLEQAMADRGHTLYSISLSSAATSVSEDGKTATCASVIAIY